MNIPSQHLMKKEKNEIQNLFRSVHLIIIRKSNRKIYERRVNVVLNDRNMNGNGKIAAT